MSGSLLYGSAVNFTKDKRDVKTVDTRIPERIKTREERAFDTVDEIIHVTATALIPERKDRASTPLIEKANSIPRAAPNAEPDDAPSISGDTIGFLKIP